MADGSGGAPGAVAEAMGKLGANMFQGIKNEIQETGKAIVSQSTGMQTQSQSQNPQQAAQQKQQQVIDKETTREATETPQQIAQVQEQLKALQTPQKGNQHTSSTQTRDGNGQDPLLKQRLFNDVQGDLAYHPNRWGEDAIAKQKQEEAQKKQLEAEEEQKEKEEEKNKLAAPVELPGSTQKGPAAFGKKPKTPLIVHQAQTKAESGRNNSG